MTSAMTGPLLEIRGLRKAYGDKVVLDGIDLDVDPHDVVCLIGSSGSGKSTLLRCLNLLEDIQDGTITFAGEEISDPLVDVRRVRRRIGMVFQAYNLFPHLSVLANCTLAPIRVARVPRAEAEERARQLLERYPEWWPQVLAVASLGPDDARVLCRSALPYTLDLVLHAVSRDPDRLEVDITGHLEGTAAWRLTDLGGATRLVFTQEVTVGGWLGVVSVLARRVLRWNHARMMAGCIEGLRTRTAPPAG